MASRRSRVYGLCKYAIGLFVYFFSVLFFEALGLVGDYPLHFEYVEAPISNIEDQE